MSKKICETCKYASELFANTPKGQKTYVKCFNPEKHWKHASSNIRQHLHVACKKYEEKEHAEN